MKQILLVLFSVLTLSSCGSSAPKTAATADSVGQKLAPIAKVTIPMTITDQQAKIEWSAANYWNLFDFADTTYINSGELEQSFVDWVILLPYVKSAQRQANLTTIFTKANTASSDMFYEFIRLAERYLYDPNSPMRNEDVYIDVLRTELALSFLPEIEKIRPQSQLDLALKNRVGDKAADFNYTTIKGESGRLSGVKSELLVVFFNNPDCPNCKEVRSRLNVATRVRELEKAGRLKVLAVYPDENRKQWEDYAPNIPDRWINAMSTSKIDSEGKYDLRAIPTLYLLDMSKKVLLKDVPVDQMIGYLEQVIK